MCHEIDENPAKMIFSQIELNTLNNHLTVNYRTLITRPANLALYFAHFVADLGSIEPFWLPQSFEGGGLYQSGH